MYIPTRTVWNEMHGVECGLWIDESASGQITLVLKMSADVLKAVYQGVACSLIVSVSRQGNSRVRCVGFEIADDATAPLVTIGTQWERREQLLFERCLTLPTVQLFLYDELSRCVAEISCTIDAASAKQTAADLANTAPHYVGTNRQIREAALDLFQTDLETSHKGRPVAAMIYRRISLSLKRERTIDIAAVTFDGIGRFRLDDTTDGAEGSGLEQSIHQLLDNVFGERLYRSPQVQDGSSRRELIDIMGISPEAPVLIESKVHAVLATQPQSSLEKRARKMDKAVEKALNQLGGAIRRLMSGAEVFRHSGERIAIAADDLVNMEAIVLLSTMDPMMNWERITSQVLEAAKKYRAFFHVLDLTELRKIVGMSPNSLRFHANLIKRFLVIKEAGTAYVRFRFPVSTQPHK